MPQSTEVNNMRLILMLLMLSALTACQSAYYAAWEKVGVEKRDILVDRVEDAKESQEGAQQQFSSALEQFSKLINFDGGELQDRYESLKDQYEASNHSAQEVSDRIEKVESVAQALFDEWQDELEKYSSESLRRESTNTLKDTQRRFNSLVKAMHKAESKMAPILATLQDNVLYLKHNLNASAIGALQNEFSTVKNDINQLISEMNEAIAQSNAFIASMRN
ncbi:MAG: putative nucleic acid-binding Zn-ribbon protein [Paraglaciecola sp.]|jgi:predicted  nucleic acid-binding Zn-ribbon protein